jgi:hypothetical protein
MPTLLKATVTPPLSDGAMITFRSGHFLSMMQYCLSELITLTFESSLLFLIMLQNLS